MIEKFRVKTKTHNFGTKNVALSIFDQQCLIWAFLAKNIQGNYCHNWNLHHQIAKFCEKTKIPRFGTNNAICVMRCLIKTFRKKKKSHKFRGKKMQYLVIFGVEFLGSYLKSAPSNFYDCKILRKNKKMAWWVFLTKNTLFENFRPRIKKKTILISGISNPKFA